MVLKFKMFQDAAVESNELYNELYINRMNYKRKAVATLTVQKCQNGQKMWIKVVLFGGQVRPGSSEMKFTYQTMKDSAWVRLIIMNIQYTMKNLSLILKNIFPKMAKKTRQRFTHSASSGLPNNSSLIFEKLVIYMLTPIWR